MTNDRILNPIPIDWREKAGEEMLKAFCEKEGWDFAATKALGRPARIMTSIDVIEGCDPGWYWWRYQQGWPWRPIEIRKVGEKWIADGIRMDGENTKLNRTGEYIGPLDTPF